MGVAPVNFAIVGAGNIARLHVQAIEHIPDARVAVICDVKEAQRCTLADSCGAEPVFDYETALRRSDIDVVSVCTPSGAHGAIALAAARAGKHLLIEKPLEITLPRIDQIIAAACEAKVLLSCIFPYRFMSGVHKAKEALDAGRLGRLVMADAYVKWYRSQAYYDESWHGTWALDGGGALMNQSIHNIDLLQWLAGPIDTIFGRTATLSHEIETEDTASAVLAFRNGALGVIQGATSCWPGDRAKVELHGDRGTIVLEEGRIVTWKLMDAEPDEEERMLNLEESQTSGSQDPSGLDYEMHRRQIVDMVAAVQGNRPPMIDGAEARKAVEIIHAVYASSKRGQPVALPFNQA